MEKGPGVGRNIVEKSQRYLKQWGLIAALVTSPAFLESCKNDTELKSNEMRGKTIREFLENNPEAPRLNETTAYEMAFFNAVSNNLVDGEELPIGDEGYATLSSEEIKWGRADVRGKNENGSFLVFDDKVDSDVSRSASRFVMKDGTILGGIQFDVIDPSIVDMHHKDDFSKPILEAPVTAFDVCPNTVDMSTVKFYKVKDVNGEWVANIDKEGKEVYELFRSTMEGSIDDAFRALDVRYDREKNLFYFGPEDNSKSINAFSVIRGEKDSERVKDFVETLMLREGKK